MAATGMRLARLIGLSVLLAAMPAQADDAPLPLQEVWARYDALSDAGKYEQALKEMSAFAADQRRPGADRARLYGMTAVLCSRLKDTACFEGNIANAVLANEQVGHYMAALLFKDSPDKASSVESFVWLVQHKSSMLGGISLRQIWDYLHYYRDAGHEEKGYGLLRLLHASGYAGDSKGDTPEYLWFELARLELKRGDKKAAETLVGETQFGVDTYIRAWQDRDYEGLWPFLESDPRYTPGKLLEMDLKMAALHEVRAQPAGWDVWLKARLERAGALRGGGRTDDAITVAEQTLDIVPEKDRTADHYYWLENELAYAYESVGRTDDAIALMARIDAADVDKTPSLVNQIVNYSTMLWRHGRYADAIKAADHALAYKDKYVSTYGAYWAEAAKVCSFASLGRQDEAEALYAPLKQKPETNFSAVTMAALCLKRDDEAAELYKTRLKLEDHRSTALIALSHFRSSGRADEEEKLRKVIEAIAGRPDVKKAVDAVGRLGNWEFAQSYWGEF